MSVQPMGGWWDDLTSGVSNAWGNVTDFFGGGSSTTTTPSTGGSSGLIGGSSGWDPLFGYGTDPFKFGDYTGTTTVKYDTSFDNWWKDYSARGGVMTPTTGQVSATQNSDIFTNISSGLNDFLSGVNSTIGGLGNLFGTGLQAYAAVQQLINAQNPSDKIIRDPNLGVVVERTQGGKTTYVPLVTAYPQFAGQIQQAEKSSNTNTILLVGALAVGAFILLKDKKK